MLESKQRQQIVDAALDHLEPPLHVALAEGQLRVEHQMPLEALVGDLHRDLAPPAIAVAMRCAARIDEG